MTQWLAARMNAFIEEVAPLQVDQEQAIADRCTKEIAAWRARPTMKVQASLKVPMTHARNSLRARLAVTPQNSWVNPQTNQREHLALRYLNFPLEEWLEINAASDEALRQRREDPNFFPDPDAVVTQAQSLLTSSYWQDVALGLSVLTGRRVTEILKTAEFHPETDWTLQFSGQLKKRNVFLPPYEIPTLIRADFVLFAWKRLRGMLDCSALSKEEVDALYAPEVRAVATRHFGSLVPTRAGHEEHLYTHLFRCIYGQIAVFYFAPDIILNLDYMAEIYGHYWYKDAETPQKRMSYSSTFHYMDYRIGTGPGHVDLRQGIKLGEPSVVVLKAFQTKLGTGKKGKPMVNTSEEKQTTTTKPVKKSSLFRCTPTTKQRGVQMIQDRDLRAKQVEDLFLNQVFDEAVRYRQVCALLAPVVKVPETDPLTTLHQVLDALEEPQMRQRLVSDSLQQHWGITLEELNQVFAQIEAAGHKPLEYLETTLEKVGKQREGAKKRKEAFEQLDYQALSFEQLENLKTPEAAEERTRRAVEAIMEHNQRADRLSLWYINAEVILTLVGGSRIFLRQYFVAHAPEIDAHHHQYDINPRFNHKVVPITDMVKIPGQRFTPQERKEQRAVLKSQEQDSSKSSAD